jgi:acyl-CoA synthetase (AMP-forming)/AMP-acid ligase II
MGFRRRLVELTTIPAALARAAGEYADAPALTEPGGPRLSWRDLHEQATVVSRALIAAGIGPGDRVAIWSPNTHHWVLAALGTLGAGGTLVPVSTRFTGHEALDVISRSRARVLFVAGCFLGTDLLAQLRAAVQETPIMPNAGQVHSLDRLELIVRVPVETVLPRGGDPPLCFPGGLPPEPPAPDRRYAPRPAQPAVPAGPAEAAEAAEAMDWAGFLQRAALVPAAKAEARAAAVRPEDTSDILFTSGTTGQSKGAMSSHRQALGVAAAWADCGGLSRADRYLVINPFFHSFGYKAGILVCLLTGAVIVPQPVFDAAEAMRLIEAERITVLPGAPTLYQTILDYPDREKYDLSSLRLAVTGAAIVPVALVERMRRELSFGTVLTAYGLTEAVVATMCRPGDDPETVARTSGRAAAGFEVRVAGPDGQPAGPGEPGEILLRGPNLTAGYLDDPAATQAAIDAEGWLHTGDIGRLDEAGYLTITDRLKDMYVCGGFNVYPAEVEQALARLDGVAESAVIGVPDPRLGEVGKAFVVTRPGYALDAEQVVAFCRQRLANYKVPRQVEFCAALPRNASGKTLKRVLREEAG